MEEIKVDIDDTYCHVIKFGNGKRNLLILPGVSLWTLEGMGKDTEKSYEIFNEDFTTYLVSIRRKVYPGYGFNDIAEDMYKVALALGLEEVYLYGVSMGGMVGLYVDSKYNNYIKKMVICSSMCRTTDKMFEVANKWIEYCDNYDVQGLNKYFIEHCYSKKMLETIKPQMEDMINKGETKDCDRFKVLSQALLDFDVRDLMKNVKCKALVLGDVNDNVIGSIGSDEIAELLQCDKYLYTDYAHAVYDEAPDIKKRIYDFFMDE